jgi:hypothetical protein
MCTHLCNIIAETVMIALRMPIPFAHVSGATGATGTCLAIRRALRAVQQVTIKHLREYIYLLEAKIAPTRADAGGHPKRSQIRCARRLTGPAVVEAVNTASPQTWFVTAMCDPARVSARRSTSQTKQSTTTTGRSR